MKKSLKILALATALVPWAMMNTTLASAQVSQTQVNITNGPNIEYVDDNSAVIAWTTDQASSAIIHYGTDQTAMNQMAEEKWGGAPGAGAHRVHRIEIHGLKPDTTYFFQLESGQGAEGAGKGGKVMSAAKSFKTLTPAAAKEQWQKKKGGGTTDQSSASTPASSDQLRAQAGPIPQAVTDKSATIWWMTTSDSPTKVKYGTDKNNLSQTAEGAAGREHRVELANLQPGTTYYFQALGANDQPSASGQLQTMGANFASEASKIRITKGPVIEYLTDNSAEIAWSTTASSSSIVRYGTDPNNLTQTAQAPWGQGTHRVTIKNLKPNTTYYFVVESAQAEHTGALAKSEPAPFMTISQGQQAMKNPEPR